VAVSSTQLLEKVQTAIAAILDGGAVQSYVLPGGRNLQHYSLKELQDYEATLLARVASESSSGGRSYARFRRPQ
jgi:hypothetical protein